MVFAGFSVGVGMKQGCCRMCCKRNDPRQKWSKAALTAAGPIW